MQPFPVEGREGWRLPPCHFKTKRLLASNKKSQLLMTRAHDLSTLFPAFLSICDPVKSGQMSNIRENFIFQTYRADIGTSMKDITVKGPQVCSHVICHKMMCICY